MAKVEHHYEELFPALGFTATNLWRPSWQAVKFHKGRGTGAVDQGGQERAWGDSTLSGGLLKGLGRMECACGNAEGRLES